MSGWKRNQVGCPCCDWSQCCGGIRETCPLCDYPHSVDVSISGVGVHTLIPNGNLSVTGNICQWVGPSPFLFRLTRISNWPTTPILRAWTFSTGTIGGNTCFYHSDPGGLTTITEPSCALAEPYTLHKISGNATWPATVTIEAVSP